MRGHKENQSYLFSYVSPEKRIPKNHPLRKIKERADKALKEMTKVFDKIYSYTGRPSIPPERLLKAQILIALYSIRSDRLFCETLDYNILYRWFLDMDLEENSFDASVFSKNRERLMEQEVSHRFLREVVEIARKEGLLSDEHFTADGTLIEAWASLKSFVKKEGDKEKDIEGIDLRNPSVDFHGEKRRNETHESKTDSEALLMRKGKGKEAKLCYNGTVIMENRNGICMDVSVTKAKKTAEKEETLKMLKEELKRGKNGIKTLGADKGFCDRKFVNALRKENIKPHVAKIEKWRIPGLDLRTIKSKGYEISQRIRKRVEEIFGWCKSIGGLRKTKLKGVNRNQEQACMIIATYNLVRIANLA